MKIIQALNDQILVRITDERNSTIALPDTVKSDELSFEVLSVGSACTDPDIHPGDKLIVSASCNPCVLEVGMTGGLDNKPTQYSIALINSGNVLARYLD